MKRAVPDAWTILHTVTQAIRLGETGQAARGLGGFLDKLLAALGGP